MPRSSSKLKAWDIYAKSLRDLGFGHPLWIPEPSPESGEIHLGDVGYLSQGKFCFLFNCMRGADDPVNRKGVPEGFKVFVPPDGPAEESAKTIRNHIMDPVLIADPVAHVEGAISYKVKEKTGAYLALKRPAHQTSLHCTEAIFQYLRAHHTQWRDYAIQRRGLKIKSQHILFVSGFVKTPVWGIGTFKHGSTSATVKIDAGAMFGGGPSASAGTAISVHDCTEPMSLHRKGPEERLPWNDDALHPDDQCIFLQYAHLKPRFAMWESLGLTDCFDPYSYYCTPGDISLCFDEQWTGWTGDEDLNPTVLSLLRDDVKDRHPEGEAASSSACEVGSVNSPCGQVSLRGHNDDAEDLSSVGMRVDDRSPGTSLSSPRQSSPSRGLSSLQSQHAVLSPLNSSEVENKMDYDPALEELEASGTDDETVDEEESESDDEVVDEEVLDYILEHCPDAFYACATSQDLYMFRQIRCAEGRWYPSVPLPGLEPQLLGDTGFLGLNSTTLP